MPSQKQTERNNPCPPQKKTPPQITRENSGILSHVFFISFYQGTMISLFLVALGDSNIDFEIFPAIL